MHYSFSIFHLSSLFAENINRKNDNIFPICKEEIFLVEYFYTAGN